MVTLFWDELNCVLHPIPTLNSSVETDDSNAPSTEVLTPLLQNVTIFRDRAFKEVFKVKMRSFQQALIQSRCCPYKNRLGRRGAQREARRQRSRASHREA
jgi:hypothetical protein